MDRIAILVLAVLFMLAAAAQAAPTSLPDTPINKWVMRNPDGPNITWENDIAYDPATHLIAWYGGHAWGYPQSNYTHLYDLATNQWHDSAAPYRPQRRCLVMLNYLDSCGLMVCTQGSSGHGAMPEGGFAGDYKRVNKSDPRGPWVYDVTKDRWENCRPLPPAWKREALCQCAYDPTTDALVWLCTLDVPQVAGSATSRPEKVGKLGLYCPRTNRITYRDLPKELHGRLGYGISADPVAGKIVLSGGSAGGWIWEKDLTAAYERCVRNDTWIYDVATDKWKQAQPKAVPPKGMPMLDHRFIPMVYHDPSGTIIMQQTPLDKYDPDTTKWPPTQFWSFDLANEEWTLLKMENTPPFLGLLAYAKDEHLLVLVGGGKDGGLQDSDSGQKVYRPSLSKQLWTCRARTGDPGRPVSSLRPRFGCKLGLAVSSSETGIVTLAWWKAAPDCLCSIRVYRSPGPGTLLANLTIGDPSFVDKTAKPGEIYGYHLVVDCPVAPIEVRKGVTVSSIPSVTAPVFNQPWHPTGLTVSVESDKKVVLRWNANKEADVIGYKVYRATGAEIEKPNPGQTLTGKPTVQTTFTDEPVDLADGVCRTYWVTAVNKGGVESGPSPVAYSFPDPPAGLTGKVSDDGKSITVKWDWPKDVKVAGFNLYQLNNHWNTHGEPAEKVKAWYDSWRPITEKPIPSQPGAAVPQAVYTIPADDKAKNHYFYVRAVNVLGQEGLYSDIMSPTDRRFHP